jgi:predicted nuclease with TOPRIM domain
VADSSKLDSAVTKFDQALSRFEQVAAKRQGDNQRLISLTAEAAQLRGDQQRLVRDLDLVKQKAKELVDTTKQAASKIDSAMSRIRSVLHTNNPGDV